MPPLKVGVGDGAPGAAAPDAADTSEFDAAFDEFAAKQAGADAAADDPPSPEDRGEGEGEGEAGGEEAGAGGEGKEPAADPAKKPADDKPAGEKGGGQGDEEAQAAAAAAAETEWLKTLDADTRKRVEAIQRDWKRMSGTVSGLTRKADRLQAEVNAARLPPAPSDKGAKTEGKASALLKGDTWKKFRDEYPEVSGPVGDLVGAILEENEGLKRELGGMSAERREAFFADQERVVAEAHPDYDEAFKAPEFRAWYDAAPQFIRAGVERNGKSIRDGGEVSHLLDLFKAQTGWSGAPAGDPHPSEPAKRGGKDSPENLADRRRRALSASAHVKSKGAGAGESPPDDYDAAWDYYARQGERRAGRR